MELMKDGTQTKQGPEKKEKMKDGNENVAVEKKEIEPQPHLSQWQCETCHLFNTSKDWACVACFSKMRKWDVEIPKKMKGLVKEDQTEGFVYKELDVPEPMEGELLIKSCGVGICGSDIILFKWTKDAQTIAKLPFTPGHEAAGLVVKKGPKTKMKIGTRVAIENHFYCGECKLCQEKRGDICLNMAQFGHGKGTIYGGCSEYFIVKEIYCYRLRTNISWKEATLLEPLGVAHNAIEQVELGKASELLVTGCGTIGLFVVSVAKALGCRKVIASDVLPWKLELAKKMGADELIDVKEQDLKSEIMKLTDGIGVQAMIECSGISDITNMSFSLLRKGGQIVLVGLPKKPLHVEDVLKDVIFKSLQLRTIHGRRIFHTWKEVEKLIAEGKIPTLSVVSHYLPLSEWKKGYDALLSGEACKVLFDPTL